MVSRVTMPLFKRAQSGQAEAQLALGKIYLEGGHGLKRDAATAFYWLNKAAANGSIEAGRLVGRSDNASQTSTEEIPAAAEKASAHADVALADWLLTGRVAANEEVNPLDVLRRAAGKGERTAQLRLAMLLLGDEKHSADAAEALDLLKRAAKSGSRAAAVRLADWCWEHCDPGARQWLEQLAGSMEPEVLYRLAVALVAEGKAARASGLLAEAAHRNHRGAQLLYALLHASSLGRADTGVPHSLKKAAFWLEKASQKGCPQASFELYRVFRLRQFSLKNSALAERYLEIAANQGHAQAQFQRGVACLRDTVGRDSDIEAARWLLAAARQGHRDARSICRLLYARRTTDGIAFGEDPSRLIKVLSRSRIALATRLEIAYVMGLDLPELLLFEPDTADRGDFLVVDVRPHLRRAGRRIIGVETPEERDLLDRARRLLSTRDPHPTDVRGPLTQRRLDLSQTLRLLGVEPSQKPQHRQEA